jgi:tetratricopeptide (TPR) repeat protein
LKKSEETLFDRMKRYLPYLLISGGYLLARYYALRGFAPHEFYPDLSTGQSIINILPLYREYLASLLWPLYLNFWHSFHPVSSLFEARGLTSLAVTVFFFTGAALAYRNNRVLFFSLLLFIVPLLPAFYIKGIGAKPFAERYLYLPSVGYSLLIAVFLSWADEKLPRAARGIAIAFIVIGGVYTVGTINRNNVWKDNFSLWSDTVKKAPDSANVHRSLGLAYVSQGQLDKAIAEFQKAIRLKPDYARAHYSLGRAYVSQGRPDWAIAEFQEAIRFKPDYAEAYDSLGIAYASQGQLDKAIAEFQEAVRLKPDDPVAHNNLGNAYRAKGQLDKADAEFQKARRLPPDFHADLPASR